MHFASAACCPLRMSPRRLSMHRVASVVLLTVLGCSLATAERLADDVTPLHYALHFEPDLASERFSATVAIDGHVRRPTRTAVMNAVGLVVDRAEVMQGRRRQSARYEL